MTSLLTVLLHQSSVCLFLTSFSGLVAGARCEMYPGKDEWAQEGSSHGKQKRDTSAMTGHPLDEEESVTEAGWFIALMVLCALLVLAIVVVCIIRYNYGGKYRVDEMESSNGRLDKMDDEEGGFTEVSSQSTSRADSTEPIQQEEDGPGEGAGKVGGPRIYTISGRLFAVADLGDDDNDSVAQYGSTGEPDGFNEDGSFIGDYVEDMRVKPRWYPKLNTAV